MVVNKPLKFKAEVKGSDSDTKYYLIIKCNQVANTGKCDIIVHHSIKVCVSSIFIIYLIYIIHNN